MKKHEYKYALDVRNNTYCLQFVMRRLWLLLLFFCYQSNAVLEKSGAASGKNMYEEYEEEATTQSFLCCFLFSLKCCVAIF